MIHFYRTHLAGVGGQPGDAGLRPKRPGGQLISLHSSEEYKNFQLTRYDGGSPAPGVFISPFSSVNVSVQRHVAILPEDTLQLIQ